ncbi:hypothetical protein AVEN_264306-1 [Araneus ventricosus]|uniref:Uncharacterized protein n=1 Tax=Araneus ventricosus TaxID=182803 RepID=A0A4Y2E432_ARAVE|nr:hypothetical protein AVEN_264306-1 [Araneus ventricosus]
MRKDGGEQSENGEVKPSESRRVFFISLSESILAPPRGPNKFQRRAFRNQCLCCVHVKNLEEGCLVWQVSASTKNCGKIRWFRISGGVKNVQLSEGTVSRGERKERIGIFMFRNNT